MRRIPIGSVGVTAIGGMADAEMRLVKRTLLGLGLGLGLSSEIGTPEVPGGTLGAAADTAVAARTMSAAREPVMSIVVVQS